MKLEGKVVLVTGGGSGAGAGIAEVCAREGAQVVITGRTAGKLESVCAGIGRGCAGFAADVIDRARVAELVDWVMSRWGRIDVLVNNAGVNVTERKLAEMTLESWDFVLDTNATGAYNLVHAVLPHMRARGEGHIVSICSTAGTYASPIAGMAYSASKHAMAVMTKFIDHEEAANGVRATVISPGEINTPILDTRPVRVSDEHKARILQPEDIGAAVLYAVTQPPNVCVTEMVIKPRGQGLI